ncbi:MAG: nuclear transport factor 2 family protein, partial [Actinomycetota bacterium]|nr:nuclear transport factor 2 family protein [Actinomycetota bacterium]
MDPEGLVHHLSRLLADGRHEEMLPFIAEDVEVHSPMMSAVYCGHEGFLQLHRDVAGRFDDGLPEPTVLQVEHEAETVLVLGQVRFHESGADGTRFTRVVPHAWVLVLREGQVAGWRAYGSWTEAREAAALPEGPRDPG